MAEKPRQPQPHDNGASPFDAPAAAPQQDNSAADTAPSITTWKRLVYLRTERSKAKLKEQDLVKERKRLEGELSEMGPEQTKARMALTSEYYDVITGIDRQRISIRWFADQMDKTIDDALQGKLFEDRDARPKPPAELFEHRKPEKKADKKSKAEKQAA